MSGCCCFSGFVILPVRMHLTVCLVFCLDMSSQPFRAWPSVVSSFKAHCEGKKKKIDPSHESVQSLHFSTWPKLEAIFSQIKGSSHEINLLCDRKYKHEVEENCKILVPIIGTIATLRRLGLPFRGHRDD